MQEKEINALWWWVGLSVGLHTIVLATLALGWWDRSPTSAPELAKVILLPAPEPTPSPVVTPPPPVPQPMPQVRRPEPVQRPEPAPRPEVVAAEPRPVSPQPVTPRRLHSRPAPALTQQLPSVPDLPTEASENTVPVAPAPVADPQPAAKPAPVAPPPPKETSSGQVACSRCPHPAYPPSMRERGIQGRVGLSVDVTPQGSVAGVTIRQSSGHTELDEAAIRAVQNWRFTSSSQGRQGLQVSVQFQLR